MRQSLELKLGQRLALTPQLQQAIKLLQLSSMDLRQQMQEALEQNPLLEEDDYQSEAGLEQDTASPEDGPESGGDVEAASDDDLPLGGDDGGYPELRNPAGTFDIDQRNSVPLSLRDHLRDQAGLMPLSEVDREIAAAIIDAIGDDGYLACDLAEISQSIEHPAGADEIEAVLHQVQNFDPAGVGARTLEECLAIQLRQKPERAAGLALAQQIVDQHLERLGSRDLGQLRRATGAGESELREAIELIQTLNPRPGTAIASGPAEYVIPDILVSREDGGWRVELNAEAVPRLRVNDLYDDIARDKRAADHHYIQNHLQEARWLVKSLRNRNETLLRVAREIVRRQSPFLEHGESAMKPMVLHDIAAALELHESTVSRATTSKYMLTPRGVFELKYFFSTGLSTTGGDMTSATAIQSRIRRLVSAEPDNKPYSDSKLTELLKQEGINVARRTVAKYRESLNIPSSSQRKSI